MTLSTFADHIEQHVHTDVEIMYVYLVSNNGQVVHTKLLDVNWYFA